MCLIFVFCKAKQRTNEQALFESRKILKDRDESKSKFAKRPDKYVLIV